MNVTYLETHDWWTKVDVRGPDDCWPWRLSTASHGYGQTWDGSKVLLAHRVSWTLTHGPIPDDMTVDHICRVKVCCNPKHLRLLTNVENATDNGMSTRTHCPRGHPYEGDNLRIYTNPRNGRTDRRCLTCQFESNARRYAK